MARVAFFTERLPSADRSRAYPSSEVTDFSYDLMLMLADQQHDVRVFSTYRDDDSLPSLHPRLQIIRPFRKWSWLEVPRLLPLLLDFQPEILHFIQPRKEAFSGLTNAFTAIPSLAPLLGRPKVIVSLYDVRASELQRNRNLLSMSDIVVVANKQQAEEVSKWIVQLPKPPKVEVVGLPSSEILETLNEREILPGLEQLSSLTSKRLLIPGDLDDQNDLEALGILLNELLTQMPELGIVFGGGWGQQSLALRRAFIRQFEDRGHGSRFLLTGPLSPGGEQTVLEASHLVLLAGRPESSLSLARWVRLSLQASRPVVLSEEQSRLDPLRFRDLVTAFVVPDDLRQWGGRLSQALVDETLRRELTSRLPDFARTSAVDAPSNAMSRIYAESVLRSTTKPLR